MEIIFHSHANKTHFYKKGCAPNLILKVRVFGTRKWPIDYNMDIQYQVADSTLARKCRTGGPTGLRYGHVHQNFSDR